MHAVENHLGSIDTWPSYIIRYLFVDTTTPHVVKELSAFFFGNDVPKALAYRLYQACNPTTTKHVRELFYEWYFIWQKSKYKRHMFMYYNMCMKKFVYLNGSCLNQLEHVEPVIGVPADVPTFCIDNKCCPTPLRSMLERVREEQV